MSPCCRRKSGSRRIRSRWGLAPISANLSGRTSPRRLGVAGAEGCSRQEGAAGASGSDGSCGNSSASCCASAARPQRLRSDLALPQFAGCPGRIGLQACSFRLAQQAGMPIPLWPRPKLGEGKRSDCLTSASNLGLMEVFLPPASGFLGGQAP